MSEMIFTIPEVAAYLKLSKSKVYHLVQTGQIPHIRIGKNVRVKEGDLNKWIEKQSWDASNSFPIGWSKQSNKEF